MVRAIASLSSDQRRIEVDFRYHPVLIELIKEVPGARFVKRKEGRGPHWTVPADLTTARRLREAFGAGLELSDDLSRWGWRQRRNADNLSSLSADSHVELERTPRLLPLLNEMLCRRPYQSADILRMALDNCLNANEPGTGKTIEIIGAVAEAGLLNRPTLTMAPVKAIENTWREELERIGYPHRILASEDAAERGQLLREALGLYKDGESFWLVINPDQLRVKPIRPRDRHKTVVRDPVNGTPFWAPRPEFFTIRWGVVALDEFHLFGLTNARSQFGLAARLLRADRLLLASGTPMGGKYKRLWAALSWLYPDLYGSWWRWAAAWLVIEDNGFGKIVRDELQPGREQEFLEAHAHHFVRRTRLEDLPGCPVQVHKTITCPMTSQQERQYRIFEREAEIHISGRRVSGHGVLAEWSRLRQIANATCRTVRAPRGGVKLIATADSGKLPYLVDKLAEHGVRKKQPEPGARALVGTVDKNLARITAAYLREQGIDCGLITGETRDSRDVIRRFRSRRPDPYVIVMTIQSGGVSLNLEQAGSAHALDESWDPDQLKQFFDRGDRGSRTTPLACYIYRTRDTIQEYIAEVARGKRINNRNAYEVAASLARARASRTGSRRR